MLPFISRIKLVKELIFKKLDQIISKQLEAEEKIKLIPQISANQRTHQIILDKQSKVLDKINSLLQAATEKKDRSALSSLAHNVKKEEENQKLSPISFFQADFYQRINQRRLEHLASLNLPIPGSTVLEVGAGIGDHTSFFIDRRCEVVSTEARSDNLEIIRTRYPNITVELLDLDAPNPKFQGVFDIVYCYGLLYHLKKPAEAITFIAEKTKKMLLLETCVSFGEEAGIHFCEEPTVNPTQSFSGTGCRPTRIWIYEQLKQHFKYVYLPVTQPSHEQFPIEWNNQQTQKDQWDLARSVFIASREPLSNPLLTEELLKVQVRY